PDEQLRGPGPARVPRGHDAQLRADQQLGFRRGPRHHAPVRNVGSLIRNEQRFHEHARTRLLDRASHQRGTERNGHRESGHPRPEATRMMRTLATLRSEERGVTLVETLVVMVLSGIIMSITAVFFVTVTKQTMQAEDIRSSTADASNIMNVVSTSIRAAVRNAVESSPN